MTTARGVGLSGEAGAVQIASLRRGCGTEADSLAVEVLSSGCWAVSGVRSVRYAW
jgi:hypothetical protein